MNSIAVGEGMMFVAIIAGCALGALAVLKGRFGTAGLIGLVTLLIYVAFMSGPVP